MTSYHLSQEQRWFIIIFSKEVFLSNKEITRRFFLRYKKQISHQTVANVLNKFEKTGAATTLPKAGRSRAFNPEQTEMMIEMIEKTPLKTLDEFTAMVNEKIKTADRKTVRRALLEKGF